MKQIDGGVCAAAGFTAAGLHCGIRRNKTKKDLALIFSEKRAAAACVYTQNKVKGAPLAVTKSNIADGFAQAVICNSGNANTCNADGEDIARAMCDDIAGKLGIAAQDVIVASTGVIGQPLDIRPIISKTAELAAQLSADGSEAANQAIMTTDTRLKSIAVEVELGGKRCAVGGIAKGSGMIHPNMATLLSFLTTDAAVTPAMLQKALSSCVTETFNMISIDGDTSTNDMVSILANGMAENPLIETEDEDFLRLRDAILAVCRYLAKALAADGEGATRLIECTVNSARTLKDARAAAKSVITSSLFKAAVFGADANWGRILCALGYADADLDIAQVSVDIASRAGRIAVCKNCAGVPFDEDTAKKILSEDEILVEIDLGDGECSATAWGCDLTYDYVKINGDYRT